MPSYICAEPWRLTSLPDHWGGLYGLCLLAQALAQQGKHADALAALNQAFERIAATGEKVWESGARIVCEGWC